MGLLPEFFTLLGIEIFAAMSLVSVLLDRDIPTSVRWLFQGAAGLGLGQLVVTEGFGTSSVIDASRFWISIFYLTLSVCSVAGLNIYLAVVRRKTTIASVFSGTVTTPAVSVSVLFVSSYLSGVDVSLTPLTIVILIVPALLVGLGAYGILHRASKRVRKSTGPELRPAIVSAPLETPKTYESLDLTGILGGWEESEKKKDQVA